MVGERKVVVADSFGLSEIQRDTRENGTTGPSTRTESRH